MGGGGEAGLEEACCSWVGVCDWTDGRTEGWCGTTELDDPSGGGDLVATFVDLSVDGPASEACWTLSWPSPEEDSGRGLLMSIQARGKQYGG